MRLGDGTDEIQRNMIAQCVLGLPKTRRPGEPEPNRTAEQRRGMTTRMSSRTNR